MLSTCLCWERVLFPPLGVQRIARLQALLPADAYPCIHDVLTRIANEASWQLDLFSRPDDRSMPGQRCGMSLAE